MTLYKTIWSPDGELYEVQPEHAADLVLNWGWSNTAPVVEEPAPAVIVGDDEAPVPVKGRTRKAAKT